MIYFIYNLSMNYPLNEKVTYIIKTLNNHGFEANIVGGCVRDILLSREPSDYDINTNATPEQVLEVFKDHKTFKTGLKHGTVFLVLDNESFEITTYRIDGIYIDYRRPETVKFSLNLKDDLNRRDFTINALAYNNQDGLLDFNNGQEDLKNQLIRCIGNPYNRFEEDALRILRAIRFASALGFEIEKETQKAIFSKKHLLSNISIERIYIELLKTLMGEYVSNVLPLYKEILEIFIPEFKYVAKYKFIENLNYLSKEKKDTSIILAIFLQPVEEHTDVLKRLKVDNRTYQEVSFLIEHYYYLIEANNVDMRFSLNKMGKEMFIKLLKLQFYNEHIDQSYYKLCLSTLDYIKENKLPYRLKDLAINGNDIKNFGFKDQEISQQLNKVLSLVIKNKIINTKKEIYNYLTKIILKSN